MTQSLLENSFQLKSHRETRDLPVYNLILTKAGPKRSADQTPPDSHQSFISFVTEGSPMSPLPRGATRIIAGPGTTTLTGTAISIDKIIPTLQSRSDRIIIDKTGLTELIDVQFTFRQDLASEPNRNRPV